jgi:flavin-dependent dehydrogenase
MYDVIIVGARCAGSPLAMMLAQKRYRVLLVDAAVFPSDTLSTHLIWPPGVAALHRWGLWPRVAELNPATCRLGLVSMPGWTTSGPWHAVDGVDYTANIRRFKLDAVLIEAARCAGADVREGVVIDGLLGDGKTVTGVKGYDRKTRTRFEEAATIVVGADGQRSTVAKIVHADSYDVVPSLTVTYYRYVSDFQGDRNQNEIYTCPPREYLFSPTDDGLTVVNLVMSQETAIGFRENADENFYRSFDMQPALGERLRASRSVGHVRGVLDQPNFYRRSYGPGWVLVGDAAYCKDPIRAQGITDAFLDAESLAVALDDAFCNRRSFADALHGHEQLRRYRTAFPYNMCLRAARFEVPSREKASDFVKLFENRPAAVAELRGLIPGSMRPEIFYDPAHLADLFGENGARLGALW